MQIIMVPIARPRVLVHLHSFRKKKKKEIIINNVECICTKFQYVGL